MTLLLLKITISALSVLILGFIADRGNPRLAGILTGFPIGTAIVVSFIAVENGPILASQSSLFSLAALSINPIFAYAYFVIGSRLPCEFGFKTNLALALIVYFGVAAGVANISWSFISATLFLLATNYHRQHSAQIHSCACKKHFCHSYSGRSVCPDAVGFVGRHRRNRNGRSCWSQMGRSVFAVSCDVSPFACHFALKPWAGQRHLR